MGEWIGRRQLLFLSYSVSSAVFVLLNRHILKSFPRPFLLTAVQQGIVAGVYSTLVAIKKRQYIPWTISGVKDGIPCAVLMVGMVLMNNVCLTLAPISGYVIARATTIIFNMILANLLLNQTISPVEILSCLCVGLANVVGTDFRRNTPELRGMLSGIIASGSQALFSCNMASTMKRTKSTSVLELTANYSMIGAVALLVVSWFNYDTATGPENTIPFNLIIISGMLNAVVAISALHSIRESNPVTVTLLGYLKSVIQALIATVVLNEPIKGQKAFGLLLTFCGSFSYSILRGWKNEKCSADTKIEHLEDKKAATSAGGTLPHSFENRPPMKNVSRLSAKK